jgi:hypothetical protein
VPRGAAAFSFPSADDGNDESLAPVRPPSDAPAETLNQPRPTRAKSAPVRARIMRFQAVNSGFAAPDTRNRRRTEYRATVRKTAQESQESGRWQKARLFGRWDFKTGAFNRSATLPRPDDTGYRAARARSRISASGALEQASAPPKNARGTSREEHLGKRNAPGSWGDGRQNASLAHRDPAGKLLSCHPSERRIR